MFKQRIGWRLRVPFQWLRDVQQVRRGPLDAGLKRRIIRSQTALYGRSLVRHSLRPVHCPLLGFHVRAYSLSSLVYLFREVFVEQDYYFEAPSARPNIVDCGSNIGMALLFFKAVYPQAQVAAFEPAPDSFALLQQNVQSNSLADVQLHEVAVGAAEGSVDFFQETRPGGLVASTCAERASGRKTRVPQVRLSRFLEAEVDFLKLDVEGAEHAVLDDLIASGRLRRIARMAIEYHHHIAAGEDRLGAFLSGLEANGFGYQIRSGHGTPPALRGFQDLLIHAYRKD